MLERQQLPWITMQPKSWLYGLQNFFTELKYAQIEIHLLWYKCHLRLKFNISFNINFNISFINYSSYE